MPNAPTTFESSDQNTSALTANNTDGGIGILTTSKTNEAIHAETASTTESAIIGINTSDQRTLYFYNLNKGKGKGSGISGSSYNGQGVIGLSQESDGVYGSSADGHGVSGYCSSNNNAAVWGENDYGTDERDDEPIINPQGVHGKCPKGTGVYGSGTIGVEGDSGAAPVSKLNLGEILLHPHSYQVSNVGVYGKHNDSGTGIWGYSVNGEGIHGESNSGTAGAIAGIQINPKSKGAGIYGEHRGNGDAGYFKGNVEVTGEVFATHFKATGKMMANDVIILGGIDVIGGADIAEDFSVTSCEHVKPGHVMVFREDGKIEPCSEAYDKKVAGVISGAGCYKPGLILDKKNEKEGSMPIALMGKVFCAVDADLAPIELGDMLTTSSTLGHAMKVNDYARGFGSVIGKALKKLDKGKDLIPILVALQ